MKYTSKAFIGKNGTEYTLRNPEITDAAAMITYLKTTAAETEFGLSYPDELDFTVADEEAFITHYAEDPGSIMITAFSGVELVGNASLSCVMDRYKTRHRATFGMAILKDHWGQGLGRKILSELILFAKSAGYEQLELEVAAENHTAVSLYKSLGFVIYGERKHSLKRKTGGYSDEYLMILEL
jgi:ribosomal protein S18 acetylase RimI-like enzyme